jgi:hypothetical protein
MPAGAEAEMNFQNLITRKNGSKKWVLRNSSHRVDRRFSRPYKRHIPFKVCPQPPRRARRRRGG